MHTSASTSCVLGAIVRAQCKSQWTPLTEWDLVSCCRLRSGTQPIGSIDLPFCHELPVTSVANGREELLNVQPLSQPECLQSPVVEPAGPVCRTLSVTWKGFSTSASHPFRKQCVVAGEGGSTLLSSAAGEEDGGQPGYLFRVNGGSSTSGCKMPFSLF